jgi:hypothetical protein
VILPEEYSPHIHTTIEESLENIVAKYETYYQDQPFVTYYTGINNETSGSNQ